MFKNTSLQPVHIPTSLTPIKSDPADTAAKAAAANPNRAPPLRWSAPGRSFSRSVIIRLRQA